MRRHLTMLATILLAAGLTAPAGCGGGGPTCGAGTVAQGGRCVPIIGACGAGTVEQDGACVPACADGQRWDGSACVDVTTCAPGTVEQGGACVPACDGEHYFDGQDCQPIPDCGPGTAFNPSSGDCEATSDVCAPGTSLVDGQCVADLICGPGTHQEDDQCVADSQAPADVYESETPGVPATFELPAAGESLLLGGIVDAPEDMNGDGYADADWDIFTFEAQAGTWLRIRASSEGATLPAFLVDSDALDAEGNLLYRRAALEPNSGTCQREVYLPRSGPYYIAVSDYNHVAAYLYGYDVIPVGGPDFSYRVEVENLGAPTPSPASLPFSEQATIEDGALAFYAVGAPGGGPVEVIHRGLPPSGQDSDVYPALLTFDAAGELVGEYVAYSTWERAGALIAPPAGQPHLVVRDHLLTIGPNRDVLFAAQARTPTDCDGNDCATGTLTEDDSLLLAWDLAAGDFFVEGTYFPQSGETMIYQTLLDEAFQPLGEEAMAHPFQYGMATHYADRPQTVYLWLRFGDGAPLTDYSIDARIIATPEVTPGDNPGLPANAMPPYTLYPAAIEHFSGLGGKMVFFNQFVGHDGGGFWSDPRESIMTPRMEQMGPVMDTTSWMFPDGYCTPLFTYIPDDGHYLHYVYDPYGDIENSTYDVTMYEYDTKALGQPTVSTPVSMNAQSLAGMGFYTFEAEANQYVEITVDPGLLSRIQPKIWVMNFGAPYFWWVQYIWRADPDAPQLGLVLDETGPTQSEAFTAGYISPYEGMSILLVMDASGDAGAWDLFSVQISVPEPPANDTCAAAEAITLDANGQASLSGANLSATSEVGAQACADGGGNGPEVFYSLELAAGDALTVTADSDDFTPVLHLFTDCAQPAQTCVAGVWESRPAVLEYTVLAGGGGTYILAVDASAGGGHFDLTVAVNAD